MMDAMAARLRCLELARGLFPTGADTEAMILAAEKLWKFVNAQPAEDSGESGSHSKLPNAETVAALEELDHYTIRAGKWDPDEIKRMTES